MTFSLRIAKTPKSALRRLDQSPRRRMVLCFEQLCANPFGSPMSDWVEGTDGLRKTRIGAWRILYSVDVKEYVIEIVAIRPRGQAYRGL